MKARKRKNVRARLSKRYARIVKDALGSHDFYSWAPFVGGSADIMAEIVADMDRISARLDEVREKFGLDQTGDANVRARVQVGPPLEIGSMGEDPLS